MNQPSMDKFESMVAAHGLLFVDNSIATRSAVACDTATIYYIPATRIAYDNALDGLANMVMIGYMMKVTGMFDLSIVGEVMPVVVATKRADLIEQNQKAIHIGYEYKGEGA
jgi:2-oxoglutarate ferredoxin oxidoreductase subunit gamma